MYVVWIGFYFKGESKNARAKVHSDGTVAGALVVDASAYEDSCLVPTIRYLRYRRYLRYAVIKFAVLMEPLRESRAPYMVRMRHSATR